jgi:hypothetical protein
MFLASFVAMATAFAAPPAEVRVGDVVTVEAAGGTVVMRVEALQDTTPAAAAIAVAELGANVVPVTDPSRSVFIGGEVSRPSAVPYADGLTITQAIVGAGGWRPTATLKRVVILRGDERLEVDVSDVLKGRAADVAVQPGDRVIVRQSPI